jgi:hypothetical protein
VGRAWCAGLVLVASVASGCRGPRPVVEAVESHLAGAGRVQVVVSLRNAGAGEGQVALSVTVRDRTGGAALGRTEQTVRLTAHERVRVTVEIPGVGSPPGGITAEAEASYPPG